MKHETTIVSKLGAAVGVALLLAPFLAGAPPQGLRSPKPGMTKPRTQNELNKLASARDKYEFYIVDVEGSQYVQMFGINNSRLAAGFYSDADGHSHSFLWLNSHQTPLDYPGYSDIAVAAVNNRGLVYGNVGSINVQHAAVLKLATGTWTLLPDVTGKSINLGEKMNDHGIGVGSACNDSWSDCLGWTWDGRAYSFTTIPGTSNPWEGPYGINDRGEEVGTVEDDKGTHAYLSTHSKLTIIDVPGSSWTQGADIINAGEILLFGYPPPDYFVQSGIWMNGVFTPLPTVPNAATSTVAWGLNDRGDYCGQWWDDYGSHGFVALRKSP
jgi:hypothetical protein